jgi:hypothetical protein
MLNINIKPVESLKDFCDVWSTLYTDKAKDGLLYYPAIKDSIINEKLLLDYFVWKNGYRLSIPKENSINNNILSKLDEINALRDSKTSNLESIRLSFPNVSDIWFITLAHLINPREFPVFDQHVYRAYKFIEKQTIDTPEYDKETKRLSLYTELYLPFFKTLASTDTTVEAKKLDEALWAFGKFIGKNHTIIAK